MKFLSAISGLAAMAGSVLAQITVVNTDSLVSATADDPKTAILPFNAGATANKLIVQVSAEGQSVASITYQGAPLVEAVGAAGRNQGIFYLDNPFTGGAADLSVTLGEGNSNGIAVGVVSISGAAPGVATSAVAGGASAVTVNVPVSGSFVVGGYAANASGTITLPAGHTEIYNSSNIGSAHAAASHANAQPSGSRTYTYTDTNSSSPVASAAVFVPASAAPAITGSSPATGATGVQPDANLTVTFSEPVVAGSGNIELWQAGGSSPVESFDASSSSQLTFDGPNLTIDPVGNLAPDTIYYVLIASTAVVDSGGNPFAGITDPSVWTFSTGDSPPLTPTFSPKNEAFGVALDANLVATFSETVQKGTGNITIHRADGTLYETIAVTSAAVTVAGGKVTINPVNNFAAGTGYHVLIDPTAIRNTAGQYYAGITNPSVWNFTALPDLTTVDGRLEWSLQQNISNPWPATTGAPGMASYALAAFHLGTDLTIANNFINQFHSQFPVPDSDTIGFDSYFWLHLIWRIYHDPAMNARLTPQARTNIEDMMWKWIRTRSRLTDAQGTEWVYHNSENHDAMQKGGLLLCAEALKDAPGYGPNMVLADGRTIGEHTTAWSDYFQRYFIGRAREGINAEIASPIYAKYTVGVYYNLMDFAESPTLRTLAGRFVTLYWADTASDWSLSGVRGGAETRCYKDNYLRLGSQYSFRAILGCYGWWNTSSSVVRTYGLIPAASSYRVPEIITACATDPARPNHLYTSRRWGRTSGSVGDDNLVTFDNGNSNLRRDTWVTPDYTMGTLTFDMNRDYLQIIDQNRAMGVMFASGVNDRIMVFGKGAASNDKSYADLSGVTRADCMIVQRDQNVNSSGSGTLVFVPNKLWNARVETGGWLFLQSGNAYCALRPAGGTYSAGIAAHGVDLAMSNIWAPVIIQTGQAANYADFAAFQASVIAKPLTFSSNLLNYTSEAGDTFTFYANSKTTPQVNGATVNLNPSKTYDSPYLSMVHGTDLATVSYPGYQDLLLDFAPSGNRTWTGTTSGDWLTANNWAGSGVPGSSSTTTNTDGALFDVATQSTVGINMNTTSGNYYLGAIDFNHTTARNIGNNSATAGVLTLNGTTLDTGDDTILCNRNSALLTIQEIQGANAAMGLALGNATNNIVRISGSGGIRVNSSITGTNRKLTKQGSGAGILTLAAANSYSGGTDILAGNVQLNASAAAGTGTISLGDTSGSANAELRLAASSTNPTNDLIVRTGSAGTKTLANRSTNSVIYKGLITANDNLTILGANSGGRLTVDAAGSTIATNKTVSFTNTGTTANAMTNSAIWGGQGSISYTSNSNMGFSVSGTNTYSGGTTLDAMSGDGVLVATANSVFTGPTLTSGAFGTGTLSIGATKMRARNITGDITVGNAITFTDNPTFTTATTNEKSLIFSGNASLNGATRTLTVETGSTVATAEVEFSGVISGTGFGITKEGAGNLLLSGTNTYTGDTTVNAGVLALTGASIADTGTLVINAGTLDLTNTETVSALFFGATPQPDGDYSASSVPVGATITTASFSGAGTLTVGAPAGSAYTLWAATNAPTGTPADDFDGDGVSNAVEFVLGGLATTNDLDKLPTLEADGVNMTFTFDRAVSSIDPKTVVTIEVSTDLVTWDIPPSPYTVPDSATGPVNPGVTVEEDTSPGFDTVTLSVPQDTARKFARLNVIIIP